MPPHHTFMRSRCPTNTMSPALRNLAGRGGAEKGVVSQAACPGTQGQPGSSLRTDRAAQAARPAADRSAGVAPEAQALRLARVRPVVAVEVRDRRRLVDHVLPQLIATHAAPSRVERERGHDSKWQLRRGHKKRIQHCLRARPEGEQQPRRGGTSQKKAAAAGQQYKHCQRQHSLGADARVRAVGQCGRLQRPLQVGLEPPLGDAAWGFHLFHSCFRGCARQVETTASGNQQRPK